MIRIREYFHSSIWLIALILFATASGHAQRGARTAPQGLDQLAQEAELIVRGSVASARVEPHPQLRNLTTVVVSMQVDETLKGTPRKTLQFRQYIWDIRDQLDAASYRKGDELLLMLGPTSSYGLRSPVGLNQGRFQITRDTAGRATALNGRGNVGLFDSAEKRAQEKGLELSSRTTKLIRRARPGRVPLGDLEEAIHNFSRNSR